MPTKPHYHYALVELGDTDVDTPQDGDVLTYDAASGMWKSQAPSGGGGNLSGIQYVDVQLNNAQILAAPSGQIELLPAPPFGTLYRAIDWLIVLNVHAGYGNVGGYVQFMVLADLRRSGAFTSSDRSSLLDSDLVTAGTKIFLPPMQSGWDGIWTGTADGVQGAALTLAVDNVDNSNDYNSIGNFTGGDAANTLSIRAWYEPLPSVPFGAG